MTCIAGITDGKTVTIGGDTAGSTRSGFITRRSDGKVWEKDGWVFGFTTSYRMGQLLRYKFVPPLRAPSVDVMTHMATTFIDALRHCFKDGGFSHIENSVESGGHFLVGHEGRLFKVESDFQVGESLHKYDSCGSGEEFALGALHASEGMKLTAEARIERALLAAQEFNSFVREPFEIVSTK